MTLPTHIPSPEVQTIPITIIPDLDDLILEHEEVAEAITLTLRTTAPMASCPACGTVSQHVQSRYTRRLRDLPASGRPVRLVLLVRRFFCRERRCVRKIFAETFPELCRPHAQRTVRLQAMLCQLGLECGGQAGARIAKYGQMSGSRDTILRLVRRHPIPPAPLTHIIGIDDFAWRRGYRYGTLICDLEQGYPIDLLPDRSVETVSAWLQDHPWIDIISRDGSAEYAAAITKGAPQAKQVSDRWHLIKNLARCVSTLLAQCLAEIRRSVRTTSTVEPTERMADEERPPLPPRAIPQAQLARQAERTERWAQIVALRNQGVRGDDIAVQVGMPVRTVRRWLAQGRVPDQHHRWHRAPLMDPYKIYLQERWHAGCHNQFQLFREIQTHGYRGSRRAVSRYLATIHPARKRRTRAAVGACTAQPAATPSPPLLTLSVLQATWLFFRRPDELTADDRQLLSLLRQASPTLETAYLLVARFLQMARERTGEQIEPWLSAVQTSHVEALAPFLASIQGDKAAVIAGVTLPWNNGRLEGHVNRLKLLKRQGYGRAKFDLLRIRVLHHPASQTLSLPQAETLAA